MNKIIAVLLLMLLVPTAVRAEPIPDYVLQKEYENCMGGQTTQQDVQRAQYCSCVRNSMRSWDANAYAALLMEQAKTRTIAPEIETLAKSCAEKVLK